MAVNATIAIDAFLEALESGWTGSTRYAVHTILWRLEGACRDRPGGLFDDPQDVISFVDGLTRFLRPPGPLDVTTKRYYYGVIRHFYRWVRANYPGGGTLPALPPHNFGRKPYTRKEVTGATP